MTRRDYVRIAAALAEAREVIAARGSTISDEQQRLIGVDIAAGCIAEALAADNPRFDQDRFARAAEGEAA